MSEKFKIGVDLDGVVFNVAYPIGKYLGIGLGIDRKTSASRFTYDFSSWPEVKAVPGGEEFASKTWHRRGFYRYQPLNPGAYEVLTALKDLGDEIYVVTARHEDEAGDVTRERLEHYRLGWLNSSLYFVNHKPGARDKAEIAELLGLNVLLEDHAGNARDVRPPSMRLKLLFNADWNVLEPIDARTQRVDGWVEALEHINSIRR